MQDHESQGPSLDTETCPSSPLLLSIPRELRDEIYSHALTVHQPHELSVDDLDNDSDLSSWFNFNILQINQQIRAEAWDYLISSNVWIHVTVPTIEGRFAALNTRARHPVLYNVSLRQPLFPLYKAPRKYQQRLISEAALSICLDDADCKAGELIPETQKPSRTIMFVYKPSRYSIFVQQLANYTSEYRRLSGYAWYKLKSLTIKTIPIVYPGSALFTKLIEPLCTIRGLEDVKFHGPADCSALQSISKQMRHPFNSAEELIKIQKYFWQQGRDAELSGRLSDAICHYKVAIDDVYSKECSWTWHMLRRLRVPFLEGSPEFNSIFHMRLDTYNCLSRCAHKYLLQLNSASLTHRPLAVKAIHSGINWARQAFQFAGMTRSQAREAHLSLAFFFYHKAEWMKCVAGLGRPEKAWIRSQQEYIYSPEDFDSGRDKAYENAGKHLFYAKEIDPSQDVLESLDEEDRDMCLKIRPPPPEGFKILEREIPLMGTWRVDPQVWKWWILEMGCHWMKKLLAQRHIVDSGAAEVETQEEITAQYAADGITWNFGMRSRPFGPVHYFHMVSDNPDHV